MRSFIGIKRGGIFVRNIIDDQYKKHRAILCFYSIRFNDNITKVSAIETRKNELKIR